MNIGTQGITGINKKGITNSTENTRTERKLGTISSDEFNLQLNLSVTIV